MGKKDKKYGPSAHPPSSFQLRGGRGNMNPYAKMADKGLINPLQRRKKKEGTPDNANDKAKKGKGSKAGNYGLLGLGMSLPLIVKRIADAKKGNIPD